MRCSSWCSKQTEMNSVPGHARRQSKGHRMRITKFSAIMPLVAGIAITAAPVDAQSQSTQASGPAEAPRDAAVTIDFAKTRGPFLHPERYNNIGRWGNNTAQRDADVGFFNEQGLHG